MLMFGPLQLTLHFYIPVSPIFPEPRSLEWKAEERVTPDRDWTCLLVEGPLHMWPEDQRGGQRLREVLTLLGRGQHSLQPLLQGVVAVDVWGVRHDGDSGLVDCAEPFYCDVCLQDHDVTCCIGQTNF